MLAVGEQLLGEVDDQTLRMTTSMGDGVGLTLQELCGALSSGVLLIGALHGRTTSDEDDSKCAQITSLFRLKFLEEFGSTRVKRSVIGFLVQAENGPVPNLLSAPRVYSYRPSHEVTAMSGVLYLLFLLFICACQSTATVVPSPEIPTATVPPRVGLSSTKTSQAPMLPPFPTDATVPKTQTSMDALPLTITVLYNNVEYDPRLETAWGFSALVERGGHALLFDTGGEGSILMKNMATLGVDPERIQSVVLSHIHGDHTGGLNALLNTGLQPTIYIPPSFPTNFKNSVKQKTSLIEVEPGQSIMEGVETTGELGTGVPEQALIIRTTKGMVIITGCAHPGIVRMVEQAISLTGDPVYLVMGGFHLGDASRSRITAIVDDFKQMGVEKVAPSHCTGERAIEMFREAYGEDFIESGAGRVIVIEP